MTTVYKPEELYFTIVKSENEFIPHMVVFSTIEDVDNNGYLSDDLTAENMPEDILVNCCIHPYEVMEGTFEIYGENLDDVKKTLVNYGFTENKEMLNT